MSDKHVIIVAMIEPYDQDIGDAEVWGVNRTYTLQKNLDMLFFFDDVECFPEGFAADLAGLGIPILTRKELKEIPDSVEYPLDEIIQFFNGLEYFTCTVSYMIAYAIFKGVKKLTLHGMYHPLDSLEYWHHVPCINFWCGVALGAGVELEISGDTQLCRPYPWQARRYGYTKQVNEILPIQTMACAYRASLGYPTQFVGADDTEKRAEIAAQWEKNRADMVKCAALPEACAPIGA